jgi:exoribonuclease-2
VEVVAETAGALPRVLIGIADVDARVPRGSASDLHARANTTSVYTAARVFPMLPEAFSTDITSLNAGVDRLALVTEYEVLGERRGTSVASLAAAR